MKKICLGLAAKNGEGAQEVLLAVGGELPAGGFQGFEDFGGFCDARPFGEFHGENGRGLSLAVFSDFGEGEDEFAALVCAAEFGFLEVKEESAGESAAVKLHRHALGDAVGLDIEEAPGFPRQRDVPPVGEDAVVNLIGGVQVAEVDGAALAAEVPLEEVVEFVEKFLAETLLAARGDLADFFQQRAADGGEMPMLDFHQVDEPGDALHLRADEERPQGVHKPLFMFSDHCGGDYSAFARCPRVFFRFGEITP